MDDDELISALAAGDDSALRVLFMRHAPWLAARLRTVLSPADVEDVIQETFVAVWQGAGRYRPAGKARAWLWGIAHRQAALLQRRSGPGVLVLAEDIPLVGDDLAEAAVSREDLARAVGSLGPEGSPEREVWRLMYVEDCSVAEVAWVMGVPEGTVKSRAHRVRRLLRAALGGREDAPKPRDSAAVDGRWR